MMGRIALAVGAAALAVAACSSGGTGTSSASPAAPATSSSPAAPTDTLATAHLGCQFYAGGSVADANPNVVIMVTAGSTAVTGTLADVTVGGPDSANPAQTDSQVIAINKPVQAARGRRCSSGRSTRGSTRR